MKTNRGFTLLEVMVATLIMAVAVAGLIGGLRTSLGNQTRVLARDRAAALARRQMDTILATRDLPSGAFSGEFPTETTGGVEAGWRARVLPFEGSAGMSQTPAGGTRMLQRIELVIWWKEGREERKVRLSAYRGAVVTPAFAGSMTMGAASGDLP